MKAFEDINDTLRNEGPEGVRARHDRARKHQHQPNGAANGHVRSGSARRFVLVPFSELKRSPSAAYLVKGLVPRVGLAVIWGPPKCGKSFWTFDLAMHIALGWSYRGRRVRQGAVVYCAFEGAEGFKVRTEAFRRSHNIDADPEFYLMPSRANLVKEHAALIFSIKGQCGAPAIVVLDTLNRSLSGSESNDEDMTAYVNAADAIREAFNCVVAIIHHCGVDGTRPRGHTSLTGTADAQLAVKRDAASQVIVTVEYMKDGPEGDTIASRLDLVDVGTDEDDEPIRSCIIVPVEPEQVITAAKVKGSARIALDLLHRAVDEGGQLPPASNHIPPNTRTTTVSLWRSYCYAGTVAESDKPDSKQKAFVRASKRLQELGLIGIWNDHVWPTGHAGPSPDNAVLSDDTQTGQTRTHP